MQAKFCSVLRGNFCKAGFRRGFGTVNPNAAGIQGIARVILENEWRVWEDEYFIAVNKPVGLRVDGGKDTRKSRSVEEVVKKSGFDWHPLYDLDPDCAGVVLLAKSLEIADMMKKADEAKISWNWEFLAVVHGHPKEKSGSVIISKPEDKNVARVKFELLLQSKYHPISLLRLKVSKYAPRIHQVRAACHDEIKCGIVNDKRFSNFTAIGRDFQQRYVHILYCLKKISFRHPFKNHTVTEISIPLPNYMDIAMNDTKLYFQTSTSTKATKNILKKRSSIENM